MTTEITRRSLFQGVVGGAGLAVLASACGSTSTSTGTTTSSATVAIPKTGAKIPSGTVKFTWLDSDDLKGSYEKPFFDAYQKAHPNVHITYDGYAWEQINQAVPLSIRNGNAPDVFELPQSMPAGQAISQGWVRPLDDIIPDFDKWKAGFPAELFIPGINVFNGKTYRWPYYSSRRLANMIFFNSDHLHKAGYDPSAKPLTWSEFRAAAKKITKQGSGNYYGLLLQGAATANLGNNVAALAQIAGSSGAINWKTGTYTYTDDTYAAAIELLLAIKSDGSLFPGWASLADADGRARMPQGVAGMLFDGPWDIPAWPEQAPDFKFGIGATPIPDNTKTVPLTLGNIGSNSVWVYAKSRNTQVVADMFTIMGSVQGQAQMVQITKGNLTSVVPKANEQAQRSNRLDPLALKANDLAQTWTRLGPIPEVRNPDVSQVDLQIQAIHPDLGETVQGILTGQLKNIGKALKDLNDRSDRELDRAIGAARGKGAKVSRADWVYPNWKPTVDYTAADYEQLKSK